MIHRRHSSRWFVTVTFAAAQVVQGALVNHVHADEQRGADHTTVPHFHWHEDHADHHDAADLGEVGAAAAASDSVASAVRHEHDDDAIDVEAVIAASPEGEGARRDAADATTLNFRIVTAFAAIALPPPEAVAEPPPDFASNACPLYLRTLSLRI